jgi:hypothetical protein
MIAFVKLCITYGDIDQQQFTAWAQQFLAAFSLAVGYRRTAVRTIFNACKDSCKARRTGCCSQNRTAIGAADCICVRAGATVWALE